MTAETYRARIDRATKRIVLPMPDAKIVVFSVSGVWSTPEDGPDATTIELRCFARKAERNNSYRLRRDASLQLPIETISVEVEVLQAMPSTRLEVTVEAARRSH